MKWLSLRKKFNRNMCFVPERRQEVTTEGGLDVVGNFEKLKLQLKP